MRISPALRLLAALLVGLLLSACEHIDDKRIPIAQVNIVFWTQADWIVHGVSGAGQHKRFIRAEKVPSNFPYTATTHTGYGGVLLSTNY